ncbi:hypothetical protein ABH935_003233 [Catenulispora sp. GAS73]|uniref:hypothetical protein n=1 Tax=Catenulispora sp. GAS73 TaxID=3156269 RepID=UPI00351454C5
MDVWWVHPDFWERRKGVNYVRARRRAEWLAGVLLEIGGAESAPDELRYAVELYGVSLAVRVDGTAAAWIGPDPDDADLWGEIGPDELLPVGVDGLRAVA